MFIVIFLNSLGIAHSDSVSTVKVHLCENIFVLLHRIKLIAPDSVE